jgi:hypothetical protein
MKHTTHQGEFHVLWTMHIVSKYTKESGMSGVHGNVTWQTNSGILKGNSNLLDCYSVALGKQFHIL